MIIGRVNGLTWVLRPGFSPANLGILPEFLSMEDERPAKEQIHEAYAHGGGWLSFSGFQLNMPEAELPTSWIIQYPEDPPHIALAYTILREEKIVLFEYSWVAIVQPDGTFDIARLD